MSSAAAKVSGGNVLGCCREAVVRLDHVLRDHPADAPAEVTTALRGVVALRDEMIARRDQNAGEAGIGRRLERVNAILSMLFGGEFPLTGFRWQRFERARDALREMLSEEEAAARQARDPGAE